MSTLFDMNVVRRLWTRLKAVVVAASIIGLVFGGWHTYRARRDSKLVELTCDEFLMDRPASHWVKLTNCEYELDDFAYKKDSSHVQVAYFLVKPAGDAGKMPIVVRREDKETLALAEAAIDKREPSDAVVAAARAKFEQPIEGIVMSGLDVDADAKNELANLKLDLDKEFVLIDAGARPRLWLGIGLLIASGTVLIVSIVLILRDRRRRTGAKRVAAGA